MPKPLKKASAPPPSAYTAPLAGRSAQLGQTRPAGPETDKQRREVAMRAAKARWQKRSARS